MFTFSSLDTYKISYVKKNEKNAIDYKVLVRLYEPIIGSIAMSLYITLDSEISLNKATRVILNIARLHKLLQIDENQFNVAIELLKHYGLLTYKANQKKANDYLFVIYPTKSAIEFFNDEKLNKSLEVVVDKDYYRQIYNYFISSVISEDEYVDIDETHLLKELNEDEFYIQLFDKYPTLATCEQAFSNLDKKEIRRLKKLFNLSWNQMEMFLLETFDCSREQLDLNALNALIEKRSLKKDDLNSDEKIAAIFENERSIAYYKRMCGRETLLPRESEMISDLLSTYQISEGVLNVVISYYFKYGKSKMGVSKNYFIKVIEEMILNGVSSTIDAMNYFRNRNNRVKKYNEEKNKIEKKVNSYQEEIKNEEESINDLQKIEEFKKLIGG